MFSASDITEAMCVDPSTYTRLTQRVNGNDTAGERAKLFVDLLDTDMLTSLDLDFVLGYIEAKALVELGVFLLPAPLEWPARVPSTRPFVPANEAAAMAALRNSSSSSSSGGGSSNNNPSAGSAGHAASNAALRGSNSAAGRGGASHHHHDDDDDDESAAALTNANNWRPPSAQVARHFAASGDNSSDAWAQLLTMLECLPVVKLRRLGFVSSLPKSVWAAAGEIMFPEAVVNTSAASSHHGAAASRHAVARSTNSSATGPGELHKRGAAAANRKKLLSMIREKNMDSSIKVDAEQKRSTKKMMKSQQQLGSSSNDASIRPSGDANRDDAADNDEEEEEEEEEEELDEFELELRELRKRRDQFLKKLARDKEILLERPRLLIGSAIDDDDPDMAASLLAGAAAADRVADDDDAETAKAKLDKAKKSVLDLRVTPVHLRIHGFSADPSSFYANALFSERQRSGGAADRKSLVTLATMQRRGEVASRRSRLAEGTAVSMHAALDPPGAVLVDWHRHSSQLLQQPSRAAGASALLLSSESVLDGGSLPHLSPASTSFSPGSSMLNFMAASHSQQLLSSSAVLSSSVTLPYHLSSTEKKTPAPLSVVSDDTEFWLALKGIVFRVPWKNLEKQQQQQPTFFTSNTRSDNNNSRPDGHGDEQNRKKNFERAAEGRRLYYRSVLCPLHTGYDITTTFLTAAGRDLDPPQDEQQLENEDDVLLAELAQAESSNGTGSSSASSPLEQSRAAFKRPCRIHINRVFALFAHDCDIVGELVDCIQACNPHWF